MTDPKNIRITTLDNGLRVVSDSMDSVETVSAGVWVNAGARNEALKVNGISHVLEHMAFKGTKRRNARAIAEEIEAVGGHINAYTSRENTAYYAKLLKEDLGLAVDIIADILQNSVMDEEELERERAVIIQEIMQAHDTPDDAVFDNFQAAAFPEQAIGRSILGTAERVGSLPRETLFDYLGDHYGTSTMILTAAGKVDHDHLLELAADAFKDLPKESSGHREEAHYTGGDSRETRDLEQAHLLMGFEGLAYEDPDFYALSMLSTIMGGGMSSRLFQEVREKRGLAYSIYCFQSPYTDSGVFGVYAGTGSKETADLIPLICDELNKACGDINDQEIDRARAQIKAAILMSLESTSSRCEQLARQMLVFNRPIPISEIVSKIEAVDAGALQRCMKRLLASPPTIAALGPIDHVEEYGKIKDRLA